MCSSFVISGMDVLDEDWHGEDLSNGLESVPVVIERSADAYPEFQVTFGSSSLSVRLNPFRVAVAQMF